MSAVFLPAEPRKLECPGAVWVLGAWRMEGPAARHPHPRAAPRGRDVRAARLLPHVRSSQVGCSPRAEGRVEFLSCGWRSAGARGIQESQWDVFNHWFCGVSGCWPSCASALALAPTPSAQGWLLSPPLCIFVPLCPWGDPTACWWYVRAVAAGPHGDRDQPRAHAWEAGAGPQICCRELLPGEHGQACSHCVPKPR